MSNYATIRYRSLPNINGVHLTLLVTKSERRQDVIVTAKEAMEKNGSRKEAIAPAAATMANSTAASSSSSSHRDIFPMRLSKFSQHFFIFSYCWPKFQTGEQSFLKSKVLYIMEEVLQRSAKVFVRGLLKFVSGS